MAKLIGMPIPQKAPSLKGVAYVSTWRGIAYLASWPKKRTRPLPTIVQEQNELFRQRNVLTKYIAPNLQITAREATKGTPLYPRDIQVALMAGTLFSIHLDDGPVLYSMATRNAVSESLDVISKTQGGILFRNADQWDLLEPGVPDQTLVTRGPGLNPFWGAGGGGGGLWSELGRTSVAVNVLDIQNLLTDNLTVLKIFLSSVIVKDTQGQFDLQFYLDGTLVTAGYRYISTLVRDSTSQRRSGSASFSAIRMGANSSSWDSGPPPASGMSCEITIPFPGSAIEKTVTFDGTFEFSDPRQGSMFGAGRLTETGKIDGIRITKNGGNLDSGSMIVVGLT